MKTCKKLLSRVFSALLLTTLLVGCQKEKLPEANQQLSYPAGEVALGTENYISTTPSVRATMPAKFDLIGLTHNGTSVAAPELIAVVAPETGVITMTLSKDASAVGIYLVSVRVTDMTGTTDYTDAFKLVVKGLIFETGVTTHGEAKTFEVKETHLVQTTDNVFKLIPPLSDPNEDYKHFSIDEKTCAVTVDNTMEAGVYPVSIQVTNRTNPKGVTFKDVLSVIVESEPYDLKYTPSEVTLMVKEGHKSPKPTLRAASATDGAKITFSLIDDHGFFTIDPETGIVTLAKNQILADNVLKSYSLQVKAVNSLGSASFPDTYVVKVDPTKLAVPVTAITYPAVSFPVELGAGEEWTSGFPVTDGSAVNLSYEIINAPAGVTIDTETGLITFAKNHYMPLKASDNKIIVRAINIAMTTPYETKIGDFIISLPTPIWSIKYHSIPSSAEAVINSGITNMDRYSFLGSIQNNQSRNIAATTPVVKNAFGRAFSGSQLDFLDYIGVNNANTWADSTNQNNDWMVSSEIIVPAANTTFLVPYVQFDLAFQYGTDVQNIYEVYAIEINSTNIYVKGEQNQDTKGLTATPANLPWDAIATTDKTDANIETKIPIKTSSLTNFSNVAIDLSAYCGKTIRIAVRSFNPSAADANSRTWRTKDLRVQHGLPTK